MFNSLDSVSRIQSIFSEDAIISDDEFHVVHDADPILPGHLLVIAKKNVSSIIDMGVEKVATFLNREVLNDYFPGGFAFIEHGRAPFCTSLNGPHWGHAHLLPLAQLTEGWEVLLSEELGATHAKGITYLKKEVGASGEYFLFGSLSKGFFFKSQFYSSEKQYFRRRVAVLRRRKDQKSFPEV